MPLSGYTLLSPLGAGRDGVSYLVSRPGYEEPAELRRLDRGRIDPARWPALVRGFKILAMFEHPGILRVLAVGLDSEPPEFIVQARNLPRFIDATPTGDPIEMGRSIAGALVAAHQMGLVHGGLDPWTLFGDGTPLLQIDFSGTETSPPPELLDHLQSLRETFRAPEVVRGEEPTAASDLFSLGKLIEWLTEKGSCLVSNISLPPEILRALIAEDPDVRPSAAEASRQLATLKPKIEPVSQLSFEVGGANTSAPLFEDETHFFQASERFLGDMPVSPSLPTRQPMPKSLGRFQILNRLGSGGMGDVFRALDQADGTIVALKTLKSGLVEQPNNLKRFRKEARLLARVRNPYVTRLIEVNEDRGIHYLVLEYVEGVSLDRVLLEVHHLDEATALAVAADIARALADAHRLGIVHRDIKPANVLVVGSLGESSMGSGPRVKLSDFGLARESIERESMALTQSGMIVGTPTYMAPEQCSGGKVDARSDVYSLGATLFHLVAGRPPFEAETWHGLMSQHINDTSPSLRTFRNDASEGICRVVEKALAKSPDSRYPDASALLEDLERLLRGEPTALPLHPALPEAEPGRVLAFDFEWQLESPPQALWPFVSNTDRLDRALGFAPVRYSLNVDPELGVRRFLEGTTLGRREVGEELPYEWVEGRRLGVVRQYSHGPFKWVVSVVELAPRGTGTTLTHRLRIEPRGRLVRVASKWGVGRFLKKSLERVYHRIDASVSRKTQFGPAVDPFEAPPDLDESRKERLRKRLEQLHERGLDPDVVEALGDYLAMAPAPELARIRPIALATRLGLVENSVVEACLHAANVGLLILLWDLLCPICRIPSEIKASLTALTDHGRCEACQADYVLDFSNSVELIFRSHPEIREADTNTYCAAGPAHSPHVVAQVRLQPGERLELELSLETGAYKIRGPQLAWSLNMAVRPGAVTTRFNLDLAQGPQSGTEPILATGSQILGLSNNSERPVLARVERVAAREDALTAARASSFALFRELFPAEILAPGQLVSVSNVTLLLTGLDVSDANLYRTMGDARAFEVLHEQFRIINEIVRRESGAVVKSVAEGILAAFTDPDAALRAALSLPRALVVVEVTRHLRPRILIHSGPAMAATLNDHLDYFGTTVFEAGRALDAITGGSLVLTAPVASDPQVSRRLARVKLRGNLLANSRPFGPLLAFGWDEIMAIAQ